MSNYDFSTLNPTDFEKLVCDLLNKQIGVKNTSTFRSFKEGKDKGIDLLLSTKDNDLEIVVQVKHYNKSTFSTLKRDLIKNEVQKVIKLNPERYIFATSLELSKHNKDEIRQIFCPFIKSLNDILGRDDLNDLLRIYNEVNEKHFKLWFSSTIAIAKILQYRFIGRKNEFQESEIKKRLRLFVSTRELGDALRILQSNKFLIITGEPGLGKTTISEILIYRYLAKDYELTVIYDDVKDIELTLRDDDSKQIFYFDDFLGHTQAEMQKSKSAENSLLRIIARIESANNKFLILNTRKFILNTFLEESERFRNFNPIRAEAKLELRSYTYGAKRRMLDNHIAEHELNAGKVDILKSLSNYICDHKNFSPRHLEFYTSKYHIGTLKDSEFKLFVIDNLENPKKIWEHAYTNQITDIERFLLSTLYSLGSNSVKENLEIAFHSRIEFEVKNNNYFKPLNPFENCLRTLNDGFILNYNSDSKIVFGLINPSLEDFLKFSITNNTFELERILFSSISIDQWLLFFRPFKDYDIPLNLKSSFINRFSIITRSDEDSYKTLIFLFSYIYEEAVLICNLLRNISDWSFLDNTKYLHSYSIIFLKEVIKKKNKKKVFIYQITRLNFDFYFSLILNCQNLEEIYEVVFLFRNHFALGFKEKFNENSNIYGRFKDSITKTYQLCNNLMSEEIEDQYQYLSGNSIINEHFDVIEKIESYIYFIREEMFENFTVNFEIINNRDWNEIAEQNSVNVLSFEEQLEDNIDQDIYDSEMYGYEEYDFDSEKINSSQAVSDFDLNSDDDYPF